MGNRTEMSEEDQYVDKIFRASNGSPTIESAPREHEQTLPSSSLQTCAGQFYSWGEAENVEQDILSRGFNITPRYLFKLSYRLWTLYITLIYMATYKPRYDPKLSLHLEAGEVITTWAALAARLDRTESQVKTDMLKLLAMNAPLSVRNGCRCIVVTLSNYRACQDMSRYNPAMTPLSSRHDPASNTTVQQYSNTTLKKLESPSGDPGPLIQDLIDLWNEICPPHKLPRVERISKKRKAAARMRLQEIAELDKWRAVFEYLVSTPFYLGGNERNWTASFDYIMRPDKAQRILEQLEAGESEYYEDKHGH